MALLLQPTIIRQTNTTVLTTKKVCGRVSHSAEEVIQVSIL